MGYNKRYTKTQFFDAISKNAKTIKSGSEYISIVSFAVIRLIANQLKGVGIDCELGMDCKKLYGDRATWIKPNKADSRYLVPITRGIYKIVNN